LELEKTNREARALQKDRQRLHDLLARLHPSGPNFDEAILLCYNAQTNGYRSQTVE